MGLFYHAQSTMSRGVQPSHGRGFGAKGEILINREKVPVSIKKPVLYPSALED